MLGLDPVQISFSEMRVSVFDSALTKFCSTEPNAKTGKQGEIRKVPKDCSDSI